MSHGLENVQAAQQLPVLFGGLGEPDPRVEDDAFGRDARGQGGVAAGCKFRGHVGDDVGVVGVLLHDLGVAAPVHGDVVDAEVRDRTQHAGVGEPTGDVVDDPGPRRDRGPGDGGAHGVHGAGDAVGRQGRDHRDHARHFLRLGDPRGPGTGGFAPDVDDPRPLGCQEPAVGDGGLGVVVPPTVGERVGGDVEHTHHDGHEVTSP